MWKESYRIGVDEIDEQHFELFRLTENLLKTVSQESVYLKDAAKSAVMFLKLYTVKHFSDEEKYHEAMQYSTRQSHKKLHGKFIASILEFEKRLGISDFDADIVKEFIGMITTWLIHHVTIEDQKIINDLVLPNEAATQPIVNIFSSCAYNILKRFLELDDTQIKRVSGVEACISGDILVTIQVSGDKSGTVAFVFTKELAFKFFETMTAITLTEIDDLVCSSLSEITQLICDETISVLSEAGLSCEIVPQGLSIESIDLSAENGVAFYTSKGNLGIDLL